MQASEIREFTDAELRERIAELEEERFRLRLRAATQTLEQPHRLRDLRRDIARMKTVVGERQGAQGSTGSKGSTDTAAPAKTRARKATNTTTTKRATARRGR